MKKLEKLLKHHNHLVFLDFEGTQFSHEMIALGAVSVLIDKKGQIKRQKKPFKVYVKAKNKIGKYVIELTGITEDILVKKGVSFATAMEELRKYVGLSFKKSSFITFGNHDMRILSQSIAHNMDFPKDICSQIQKNYFDYAAFINEFVRDEQGNPCSLVHNCQTFNVSLAGDAHDPAVDAINLANLYDAFLRNIPLVAEYYKKSLPKYSHFPSPINEILKKLNNDETVSPHQYDEEIRKYLS
ncbi:MAG: exonuclease domain-containing protein [Bacilli bacterium]